MGGYRHRPAKKEQQSRKDVIKDKHVFFVQ